MYQRPKSRKLKNDSDDEDLNDTDEFDDEGGSIYDCDSGHEESDDDEDEGSEKDDMDGEDEEVWVRKFSKLALLDLITINLTPFTIDDFLPIGQRTSAQLNYVILYSILR